MSLTVTPLSGRTPLLSAEERESVAEISATIGAAFKHGCIYFGISNNVLKREAVEQAIAQSLAPKGITASRLVVAEREEAAGGPSFRVLISDPIGALSELAKAARQLVFVHGLPELIRFQTEGDVSRVAPAVQLLNYRRELFRDRSLCAFFWLDVETVPYLMQKAPDFWSFRSGTAQFADLADLPSARDSRREAQQEPSNTRFAEDLQQQLSQLAVYRKKSPPDENAIANLLLEAGRLYVKRRDLEKAFEALEEALATFEHLGLEAKISEAKTWLGRAYKTAGRLDKAEASYRQALEIDQRRGGEWRIATDYDDLSGIYKARGQLEEAEKWLRKAIEIAERLGDEPKLAIDYNNLSQIYQAKGQLEEAEKWLRKAIEIAERLGDEPKLAIHYNNLSQIYDARGQLDEAEKWLRKAIEIAERLGDEPNLAIDYNNLSQVYDKRGQLEEAEKWLRKAIEIDERLGDEPNLAIDYNNLSQVYDKRGQLDEAEKWLRKAIGLMEPKGPSAILGRLKDNLAVLSEERQHQAEPDSKPE